MIEVGLRGPLNNENFKKLKGFLDKNARKTGEDDEVVIFFGENKKLNIRPDAIRIKKDNQNGRLVFKNGRLGEEDENEKCDES